MDIWTCDYAVLLVKTNRKLEPDQERLGGHNSTNPKEGIEWTLIGSHCGSRFFCKMCTYCVGRHYQEYWLCTRSNQISKHVRKNRSSCPRGDSYNVERNCFMWQGRETPLRCGVEVESEVTPSGELMTFSVDGDTHTHSFPLTLTTEKIQQLWHPNKTEQASCPDLGLQKPSSTDSGQSFLEKWLILGLGQDMQNNLGSSSAVMEGILSELLRRAGKMA